MQLKILTVDDSRAVRIIVKKAFKTYNVEIHEAANGVEGLAMAAKQLPDLILLDVTMPVMDGVEMLTKLKAEPALKSIPIIMLTAEAGREMVLKIAKLGIRDYIVKPFKEDVLNEKVGRIIDLRPITETQSKRKTLSDPCEILVVEDKPVIIQQIISGIHIPTWKVHGVSSTGETIDYCQKSVPDIIIISLSLPDEAAYTLFRLLRSNMKTKYIPVFALAVKTDLHAQQQAQQFGFSSIITKPIDYEELETKIAKSINLDTSERYFQFDEDFLLIRLPENTSTLAVNEIGAYLKPKISEAVDQGYSKVIFDVHSVRNVNMALIKLLVDSMQICQELTLAYGLVGNPQLVQECRGFEESKDWKFHDSIDAAKASL
ncbi:MAG: response regulator [Opitutales bacterium]|jgi:two-component system cell cycle response regulator